MRVTDNRDLEVSNFPPLLEIWMCFFFCPGYKNRGMDPIPGCSLYQSLEVGRDVGANKPFLNYTSTNEVVKILKYSG